MAGRPRGIGIPLIDQRRHPQGQPLARHRDRRDGRPLAARRTDPPRRARVSSHGVIAATAARVRARIKPTGCGLGATHSTSPCTIEDAKWEKREMLLYFPRISWRPWRLLWCRIQAGSGGGRLPAREKASWNLPRGRPHHRENCFPFPDGEGAGGLGGTEHRGSL
jgi:hypothetical protein